MLMFWFSYISYNKYSLIEINTHILMNSSVVVFICVVFNLTVRGVYNTIFIKPLFSHPKNTEPKYLKQSVCMNVFWNALTLVLIVSCIPTLKLNHFPGNAFSSWFFFSFLNQSITFICFFLWLRSRENRKSTLANPKLITKCVRSRHITVVRASPLSVQ